MCLTGVSELWNILEGKKQASWAKLPKELGFQFGFSRFPHQLGVSRKKLSGAHDCALSPFVFNCFIDTAADLCVSDSLSDRVFGK